MRQMLLGLKPVDAAPSSAGAVKADTAARAAQPAASSGGGAVTANSTAPAAVPLGGDGTVKRKLSARLQKFDYLLVYDFEVGALPCASCVCGATTITSVIRIIATCTVAA